MPLKSVEPPAPAYEAVRSRIAGLAAASAFGTPSMMRAAPKALELSTPHRIAVLPASRINSKLALRSHVIEKGWRFLVHEGDQVIATADAAMTDSGEYRFGHLTEGPFVQGTEEALRRAEANKSLSAAGCEPVFLLVPHLHVVALWLRAPKVDADRLMVLPPAPQGFSPYKIISTKDFASTLADLAKETTANKNRPSTV